MAKFEFLGIDKYQAMLGDLGAKAEGVCKRAVYVGAEQVADQIKQNLRATGHTDTGQLIESMSLDTMKKRAVISTPRYRGSVIPSTRQRLVHGRSRTR